MRISDWSSDVCSSDLTDLAALNLVRAGSLQLFLLGDDKGGLGENGVAIAIVLEERRQPHAVTDFQITGIRKGAYHLVGQFRELQQVVKVLLGNRQALGHLRPDAIVIGFDRMAIIARPFEIGDVLAFPVLEVREPEGAFVIERFDPGDEIDFAVIVRMEPGDRKMATGADDQLRSEEHTSELQSLMRN